MSVNSYLRDLASELVLSNDERTSITTSIATLSSRLTAYFGVDVTQQFQFGSSTRGTILPRKADAKSDIDYMVVFNTSDGTKKPQTYLDRLRRFAESKYSTSEISQSSPTMVLSLNHIKFELVPAVYTYTYGYQIPSPASVWSDWMYTDPSGTNQALEDKNKQHDSLIKPLVRLVKYWNAINERPFSSFDLERYVVGNLFWTRSSLRDYFYDFWSGYTCSFTTPQYIKDKVERAKGVVRKAKDYEEQGLPTSAELEIKKVVPPL